MCKRLVTFAALGLLAFSLAGCGDSAVVEECIKKGQSAKFCRCRDKILRSELSGEEYRLLERATRGDDGAVEKAMRKKGVGFAFTFGVKMAGADLKSLDRCSGDR